MTAAISARGLRKSYGDFEAVRGVDLEVAEGEVFALLGPNGAGKSTTVEILEGLRPRTGGEVSVLGADPATAPRSWRAGIGVVQQAATDLADITVAEAVHHHARYYPDPRDPDEVVALVGLADKARTRAGRLSGGQRRRLDVALGIIGRPRVLFLDEPTTGFDPEARRQFWGLVRDLAREGATILLTTHYLDEVEALADRLAVIAGGRLVAEGTPTTVGGRDRAKALVTWVDPDGVQRSRATTDPVALVVELNALGPVADLTVTRPTLEDVYLELIA
ncbi:ABC transporter ATP-binding protein [Actinosynnema pretiosum subsp. pretiosum]|uniref:ABC transporter related n=2 Tax=Actinosynnema TaxID=40566 RepID=C6WI26_ACTMD|nr:ABC transporter ATP-binding protein [Actinosynnema mirum]ACU34477.1 ABC transporter related [Actinosynnema mirum DSM 43827]AXX27845.1 ABC-type multidrug transport system, ATPase component [Actinosynnema pretiosum subsp. pretiosum]QUF01464.1 ABC transporter ATP-binding protein [Actinosynnema pretiosum subsp. pretiosum]